MLVQTKPQGGPSQLIQRCNILFYNYHFIKQVHIIKTMFMGEGGGINDYIYVKIQLLEQWGEICGSEGKE